MKSPILFLLILLCFNVKATNYYFSSLSGNDSRTAAQAQNSTTPWQTLSKLNSYFSSLAAGDTVFFKRGETFYGEFASSASGSSTNAIVFTGYGTGDKPVFSGAVPLTFTNISGNRYQSQVLSTRINTILTVDDGPFQQIARYPNTGASQGGYLYKNSSASGNDDTVICAALTTSPSLVGSELCVRTSEWLIYKKDVLTQSSATGDTCGLTGNVSLPSSQEGIFFQGHPNLIDQDFEWAWNASTSRVEIQAPSLGSLSNVKAGLIDDILTISPHDYLKFIGIKFQYADNKGIFLTGSGGNVGVKIIDCDFEKIGRQAIDADGSDNMLIENCTFTDLPNVGIDIGAGGSENDTIRNCTFYNIGLKIGMNAASNGSATAINATTNNGVVIENCSIINVGYSPIYFGGKNIYIQNNIIDSFNLDLDDGGGIYGSKQFQRGWTNVNILNNIIRNGIGAPYGRTSQSTDLTHAIYLDQEMHNVLAKGNKIENMPKFGIYSHGGDSCEIRDNIIRNCGVAAIAIVHANTNQMNGLIVKNNVYLNSTTTVSTSDNLMYISVPTDYINSLGVIDSNYYGRLRLGSNAKCINVKLGTPSTQRTLAEFTASYAHEQNSTALNFNFANTAQINDSTKLVLNPTSNSATIPVIGTYKNVKNQSYTNGIPLAPFGGEWLYKVAGLTVPPETPDWKIFYGRLIQTK